MKTAFLFSGQGAQYQGMGQDLYHEEPIVKQTFDESSEILSYDMAEFCFSENETFGSNDVYTAGYSNCQYRLSALIEGTWDFSASCFRA